MMQTPLARRFPMVTRPPILGGGRLGFLAFLLVLSCGMAMGQGLASIPNRASEVRGFKELQTKLLAASLSVNWEEAELGEVLKELRRRLEVNLVMSIALRKEEPPTLNLVLKDISALGVLRIIESQTGIRFQHRHGVIVATTPEDAMQASMVLKVYQVADLLYVPPDFPAPIRLGLRGSGQEEEPITPEPQEQKDPAELIELLRVSTGGDKVWDVPGAFITHSGSNLFVFHSTEVHSRFGRTLHRLR